MDEFKINYLVKIKNSYLDRHLRDIYARIVEIDRKYLIIVVEGRYDNGELIKYKIHSKYCTPTKYYIPSSG